MVGYVERDAYAASVLLARMEVASLEPAPVWCGNLEDLDTAPFLGVDLVTAGFPCQPWSAAGKRKGTDDERWIWPAIASLLRRVRPRFVFLENVRALISGGGLGLVLADLADLGFDAEWTVLSAGEVGASQQRERVFILAHADKGRRGRWRQDSGFLGSDPQVDRRGRGQSATGRSETVAHASSARRPEVPRSAPSDEGFDAGWPSFDGDIADRGGEDVADGDSGRREVSPLTGLRQPEGWGDADRRGGTELADGDIAGRQRTGWPRSDRRHVAPRVPAFPPGPDERDLWNAILECEPGLEPSLCRVADGAADWLGTAYASRDDQLRLLGNGVVPQQADAALRILWNRKRERTEP